MKARPSLAQSFAEALKYSAEQRGWLAFIPYVFLLCIGIGAAAAWAVPDGFFGAGEQGISTTVYGGILAFNGFLLAVGATAFSKIYEIMTGPVLGPILRKHGLIDEHLAFVDVNQLTLVTAAMFSLAGLITALLPTLPWVDRLIFSGAVGLSLYALARTISSAKMMHELIWEQAHADDHPSDKPNLRTVRNGE